jgi:hypothetical protein
LHALPTGVDVGRGVQVGIGVEVGRGVEVENGVEVGRVVDVGRGVEVGASVGSLDADETDETDDSAGGTLGCADDSPGGTFLGGSPVGTTLPGGCGGVGVGVAVLHAITARATVKRTNPITNRFMFFLL